MEVSVIYMEMPHRVKVVTHHDKNSFIAVINKKYQLNGQDKELIKVLDDANISGVIKEKILLRIPLLVTC